MDPITIGLMIASIGKLFGGFSANAAGGQQNKAFKMAAAQARQEAGFVAAHALEDGERTAAEATVQAAANGGGLTGSSMDVIADLGRQSLANARNALYSGATEARGLIQQGKVAKKDGQTKLVESVFDAGSTFLGGMAQQAQARRAANGGSNPRPATRYRYGDLPTSPDSLGTAY